MLMKSFEKIKVVNRYYTSKYGNFTPIKNIDIDHVVCQPKHGTIVLGWDWSYDKAIGNFYKFPCLFIGPFIMMNLSEIRLVLILFVATHTKIIVKYLVAHSCLSLLEPPCTIKNRTLGHNQPINYYVFWQYWQIHHDVFKEQYH